MFLLTKIGKMVYFLYPPIGDIERSAYYGFSQYTPSPGHEKGN